MNDLELLLNSWAPRRPSPKLRRRIFDAPPAAAVHAARMPQALTPRFIWLAPAAACLLLVVAIVSQRNGPGFTRQASAMPMIGMISNQSYAAFIPSRFQTEQNSLRNTFEWTNLSRSATTQGFLSPMKEND